MKFDTFDVDSLEHNMNVSIQVFKKASLRKAPVLSFKGYSTE